MMNSIRAAEAAYKQETLVYLGCSPSLTDYYPQTAGKPDSKRWRWSQPGHPQYACWQRLSPGNDKVARFGYAVVAGKAGDAMPATSLSKPPSFPNPTTQPWYVVQAAGDRDDDLKYSIFVTTSVAAVGNAVIAEDDTE